MCILVKQHASTLAWRPPVIPKVCIVLSEDPCVPRTVCIGYYGLLWDSSVFLCLFQEISCMPVLLCTVHWETFIISQSHGHHIQRELQSHFQFPCQSCLHHCTCVLTVSSYIPASVCPAFFWSVCLALFYSICVLSLHSLLG